MGVRLGWLKLECDVAVGAVDGGDGRIIVPILILGDCIPLFLGAIEGDLGQVATVRECTRSNIGHAVRDCDAGQAATTAECACFNKSHTFWNCDTCYIITIIECKFILVAFIFPRLLLPPGLYWSPPG